jgi:galactose mutarotase-like enzyme
VTELRAPDGSITAKFVSIGATLTELWVKDKNGKARDVVLGYDNPVSEMSSRLSLSCLSKFGRDPTPMSDSF